MASRRLRMTLIACAVTLAAAAGCGGQTSSSAGGFGDSAKAVPAGALVFVDVNTDRSSDPWKTLTRLGARFPGYDQAVASMRHELDSTAGGGCTVSFTRDVEPALGDDVGVAITSLDTGSPPGSPNVLLVASLADSGKAKSALTSCSGTKAAGSYKGWDQYRSTNDGSWAAIGHDTLVIATTRDLLHESIDVRDGTGTSMADDPAYVSASHTFPSGSLLTGYVDTQKAARLLSLAALAQPSAAAGVGNLETSLARIRALTFALRPTDAGVHVSGTVTAQSASMLPQTGASDLVDRVPASAFAFVAARNTGAAIQQSLRQALAAPGAAAMGPSLALVRQMASLLSGGMVLYLRPGMPVSGALVLEPANPAAALASVRRLVALAARGGGLHATATGAQLAPGVRLTWRRVGNLVVVGNDPAAGTGAGGSIADSSTYTSLLRAAGAPGNAQVGLYVDVPSVLGLYPGAVDPNLKQLGGIVAWSSTSGATATADLFVQVK